MSRPQHLCIRPLTIHDLSQVLNLENLAFPDHERASILKLVYRLSICPELCSGLFIREFDNESVKGKELPDHSTIKKETLIGHIVATKMYSDTVNDESMLIPKSFFQTVCNPDGSIKDQYLSNDELKNSITKKNNDNKNDNETEDDFSDSKTSGHTDAGKTIGIHSVAIHPDYRNMKLATLLMKDYLQKMSQQYVADNVALLCKDKLIKFYAGVGFSDSGISKCTFGNEEWHDMTLTLEHDDDDE